MDYKHIDSLITSYRIYISHLLFFGIYDAIHNLIWDVLELDGLSKTLER